MAYKQLVNPTVPYNVWYGQCLKQVRSSFRAPATAASATIGANQTKHRRTTHIMPNVAVPVWFDHWGTYGSPPRYANWGHVVLWVPSVGKFMSSPIGRQKPGYVWYNSIADIERIVGAKFRFWSLDINGVNIAEVAPAPKPKPTPGKSKGLKAMAFYHRENREKRTIKPKERLFLTHSSGTNRGFKQNCAGIPGNYIFTGHVYGDGFAEGDILEIRYDWYLGDANQKDGKTSSHYLERVIADKYGMIRHSVTFQRAVTQGYRVFMSVYASQGNKKNGVVSVLDSDATALG